jgi:hypothetical protein
MTTFVEKFFMTLCSLTDSNCTYNLICEDLSIVQIQSTFEKVEFISNKEASIDNLKKEFVPCFCDSGHPILVALRNFDKSCICTKSYLHILQRSPSFPTKSVVARVIAHNLSFDLLSNKK